MRILNYVHVPASIGREANRGVIPDETISDAKDDFSPVSGFKLPELDVTMVTSGVVSLAEEEVDERTAGSVSVSSGTASDSFGTTKTQEEIALPVRPPTRQCSN